MGNVVLDVVVIASGAIGAVVVVVMFVWAAVKDGQDNDEAHARLPHEDPSA